MTDDDLWRAFHDAGFTDIWYAHPGPLNYRSEKTGPRWHAGIWTGPKHAFLCVKPCDTTEDAEAALSPEGWSPEEAVKLALEKWASASSRSHISVAPLSNPKT